MNSLFPPNNAKYNLEINTTYCRSFVSYIIAFSTGCKGVWVYLIEQSNEIFYATLNYIQVLYWGVYKILV